MTLDDPCPMTGERHLWGDWEPASAYVGVFRPVGKGTPTGDRARRCRTCGRWQADWAGAQSQREETL